VASPAKTTTTKAPPKAPAPEPTPTNAPTEPTVSPEALAAAEAAYKRGYADGVASASEEASKPGKPKKAVEAARTTVNAWWCGACGNSQQHSEATCLRCGTPRLSTVESEEESPA